MSYLAEGAYYCRGTFQRLADALASAVTENGGEVLLRSSVRRICVDAGKATGVVLENGQRIEAPRIISNADATQTIEELVGRDAFPASYTSALRRLEPSVSAFVAYVATRLPLSEDTASHETFLYSSLDHDEAYRTSRAGNADWLSVTIPSLADPGLCPPDEQLMIMTTLVPYGSAGQWRSGKEEMLDRLIDRADRHFRGLKENVSFAEGGSPRTLERYTRNRDGALYGWALSPAQVGQRRLDNDTPIAGLHLVGHWTRPGGGVYGVVSSGIRTARLVLGFSREAELWHALQARS
jgi:prolycopene isomerase